MYNINQKNREFVVFGDKCLRISQMLSITIEHDEDDDLWDVKIVLLTGDKLYGCKDKEEATELFLCIINQLS
jgi:stalled ribosome rescue protein Dom34